MIEKHERLKQERKFKGETRIEGIGIVREYGDFKLDKMIKRLLKSKAITD